MDRKEREELIEQIPWVTRIVPRPRKGLPMCDGIKWSKVALRDIYSMGGNPPRGIKEEAHCKNRARWRFRALRVSEARSGNYCMHHLMSAGLYHDYMEERRTESFVRELLGS